MPRIISRPWSSARACAAKRRYRRKQAIARADHLHGMGIHVRPYHCTVCGKYHLSHENEEVA